MSVWTVLVVVLVLALVAFGVRKAPWIDQSFKSLIIGGLLILAVIFILGAVGACDALKTMRMPHF